MLSFIEASPVPGNNLEGLRPMSIRDWVASIFASRDNRLDSPVVPNIAIPSAPSSNSLLQWSKKTSWFIEKSLFKGVKEAQ